MGPKELFAKAVESAASCIERVTAADLGNTTPCSEWDLRTLLNHIVGEVLWIPDLLAGKTIAEVGTKYDGDVLGDDPVAAWSAAKKAALEAVEGADLEATTHLSYGDFPARSYINDMVTDVLIHGWDVGQSINCSVIFEHDVAQAAYDHLKPSMGPYREGGFVGAEVPVPEDANIQTKLLGMMGRKER